MKLTTPQIETIERYILSWDISNKTFYYEILDHFISAVEERMESTGEEFDYTFPEVTFLFAEHRYKKLMSIVEFFGPKALEVQFVEKTFKQKFKKGLAQILEVFLSKWLFLIMCISLVSYLGYTHGLYHLVLVSLAVFNLVLAFWYKLTLINFKEIRGSLRNNKIDDSELSIEDLKKKKFYGRRSLLLFITLYIIGISINHFDFIFNQEHILLIVLLLLVIPFAILSFQDGKNKLTV